MFTPFSILTGIPDEMRARTCAIFANILFATKLWDILRKTDIFSSSTHYFEKLSALHCLPKKKSTLVVVSSYELCVVFVFSRLNTLAAGKWLQRVSNLPPAQYLTRSLCYVRINNGEEGTHILRVWYEQKIHTRARRVPKLKSKLITWLIMSQICSLCEDEHQLCVGFWSCAKSRLSSLARIRYSSKR